MQHINPNLQCLFKVKDTIRDALAELHDCLATQQGLVDIKQKLQSARQYLAGGGGDFNFTQLNLQIGAVRTAIRAVRAKDISIDSTVKITALTQQQVIQEVMNDISLLIDRVLDVIHDVPIAPWNEQERKRIEDKINALDHLKPRRTTFRIPIVVKSKCPCTPQYCRLKLQSKTARQHQFFFRRLVERKLLEEQNKIDNADIIAGRVTAVSLYVVSGLVMLFEGTSLALSTLKEKEEYIPYLHALALVTPTLGILISAATSIRAKFVNQHRNWIIEQIRNEEEGRGVEAPVP